MTTTPRLLPLVAIAIGGVLAVKTLSGVQALPELFAATRAHAEEAPATSKRKGHGDPAPATVQTPSSQTPSSQTPSSQASALPAPKPPMPACIQSPSDLAREAGVSPGELQVLQNLKDRRGQLDDRERALDTQLHLLAAAEAKVDAKLKAVTAVKSQIQGLIGQADQQQQADVDRLTQVYQKMKPRDAAAVMATLEDRVRIPVAAKMKDSALAAILSQMPTVEAKKLTESLAQRADNAKQALNAASQQPTAAPVAAAQSSDPLVQPSAPAAKAKRSRAHRLAAARPLTSTAKSVAALTAPKVTPTAAAASTAAATTPAKAASPLPAAKTS